MFEVDGNIGFLLAFVLVLVSYLLWKQQHVQYGYPDGPFCVPIIGNIPQVVFSGFDLVTFMNKYAKVYGNVSIGANNYNYMTLYSNRFHFQLWLPPSGITVILDFHYRIWRQEKGCHFWL